MAVARVMSAQPSVLGADIISIETDLSRGLYSFAIVGLPGKAVEEARDRIGSAIKNSGFKSPKSENHKVVISLAPADLRKEGPLFDLPMAIAYLIASENIKNKCAPLLVGELSLDGSLRPIRGALSIAREAYSRGIHDIIVPFENREEAALQEGVTIYGATHLLDVVRHIDATREDHARLNAQPHIEILSEWNESDVLLEDIRGQESAKRGLIIAAAGRHNALMMGPPGTGKTMLARAFQSILPPLTREEILEVTSIHSLSGSSHIVSRPPFRAPHHTASHTSLVGGGTHPRPGEVTLAHRGVLFLDEFPEFERRSIDALRQPLEDRVVSISRVRETAIFPADFILIAALNPTRGTETEGEYSEQMLETYKHKISSPILDRIDLWLTVPHVSYETLMRYTSRKFTTEKTETVVARECILQARERQLNRLTGRRAKTNGEMSARDIEECIPLTSSVIKLLTFSAEKMKLSPRGYHRLIKVSRTIADLDDADEIGEKHVLEALQFRIKL